ncbi:MAG: PIN domain-containing protein [Porticoccaceae bacterium]
MRVIVLYDACVLYPAPLRDLLLEIAIAELVAAKWTNAIHDEWIRNLLTGRPELTGKLEKTRMLMDQAVPDALVENYEPFIERLSLPDKNDRHVLAAAIKCNAQVIVTFNLKDFPLAVLADYGMEPMHPDEFIEHQLGLSQGAVIACAKRIRARLKNPEISADAYLETLASQRLPVTADKLKEFIDLI